MLGGPRRLAAIMFTDVVGFSALTQQNEPLALRLLDEHRNILRPIFVLHEGREVKTLGDGFLVEFESALEATKCAVALQQALFERNRRSEGEKIEVRVGIHVGDVVHSEHDVYGDAVNIAFRIQPLAEAGGIAVTGPVYEQVRTKLPYDWVLLERAFLKNIDFPVAVYRVELPWSAPPTARLTPFVDRTTEIETFAPLINAANHGEGIAIALTGEPGIGKTRLAEELAHRAARLGFRTLRGRGYRGETTTPYAHWAELVRDFVRDAPNPLLYKVCANCSREVVQLVPELVERLGPGPPERPTSPDQAQLRFFEGIAQFFENVATETPLAILLDDLQWADSASLRILEYFGRRIAGERILLLLAYREPEELENPVLREVVDELGRAHRLVRRSLKRFDAPAASEMLRLILGHEPLPSAGELVRLVHEKSGGNPFFLESILQALIEDGALVWTDRGWEPKAGVDLRLPPGVQSLIRQRLKHLDEGTVTTLRMASVLGSQFSFDALARLTEAPPEELLAQLERGLQSHLLEELPAATGSSLYAFSDSQVRDALYGEISLVRRGRYHLKAGEILESIPASLGRVTSGELAHHFLLGHDPDRALTYTLKAADEAARFYAREEALRQYATAQELLEGHPDDVRRYEVMEKTAEQLNSLGKPEEALSLRRRVAEGYERLGRDREAGNVHRIIAREFSAHNEPARAQDHWEAARRLLETGPESVELARLYDTMGGFLFEEGKSTEAIERYGTAIEIAVRVGDRQVQATARMVLAALVPMPEGNRVFETLEAALVAAHNLEGQWLVPNVEMVQAIALLHIRGDGRAALRKAEDGMEHAHRNHDVLSEMAIKGNMVSYIHLRTGDLERAERSAQEYLAYAGDDPHRARATVFIVLADVAQMRGDFQRAEKWLFDAERLLEEGGDWAERAHMETVLARCAVRRGRLHSAIEHLSSARALARNAGPPALNAIFYLEPTSELVEVLLDAGEPADTARAELADASERFGEDLGRAYRHRAEGFWALHHQDLASAVKHFEQCAELWKKLAWHYELARTRATLARLCEKRGESSRASALADQAKEFFSKVGARADLEEISPGGEARPLVAVPNADSRDPTNGA